MPAGDHQCNGKNRMGLLACFTEMKWQETMHLYLYYSPLMLCRKIGCLYVQDIIIRVIPRCQIISACPMLILDVRVRTPWSEEIRNCLLCAIAQFNGLEVPPATR